MMASRLTSRWTIALILIITVLLTTQLLRHSRNPDSALIPAEWQDWVTSHWKGGEQKITDDQLNVPPPTTPPSEEEVKEPEKDKGTSEPPVDAAPQELPPAAPTVAEPAPVDVETPISTPSEGSTGANTKKPWPWQKPKKPTVAPSPTTSIRPSPTAAYEILETQAALPAGFDATTQMFDLNGPPAHDPAGPRPDQIVILTATDGHGHNEAVADIVDKALHNRREYCAHHGYINHFVNMSRLEVPAPPVWKKLPAIIETFQTYPDALWVWWLDLDAIIMTLDFKIEERILNDAALDKVLLKNEEFKKSQQEGFGLFTAKKPDVRKVDLLIAQDQSTMNAGSFMLRRSEWTRMMLDVWRDPLFMAHHWPMEEQDALIHIVKTNPEIRSHVGLVDMRTLNEYLFTFHKGDLVVHFAGCWVENHCQVHWEQMWKQRYGTLDWPPKGDGSSYGKQPQPQSQAQAKPPSRQRDVGLERRRARRAARGEMDPVEQIARGYYG